MELKAGYKKTEVGIVPEEWEIKPLSVVLEKARLGGNYPNQDAETDFPLMKMGNIARGVFDVSTIEYISPRTDPETQHQLACGDVLFNTRNTLDLVGKVAMWRDELPVAYYNSNLLRLEFKPTEIASGVYANYWLNTSIAVSGLRALATGTTSVAAIYTRDLLGFSIAVPPLPEQSAIATALNDVDELLAAQDALIAKKRALKQGAMQELLTGKRRLPGFSGEWEVRRLGDHLEFLGNGANSRAELMNDGRVRYLHYGDIHGTSEVMLDPTTTAMPFLPEVKAARLDRLRDGDLVFADASEDLDGVGKSVELQNVGALEVVSGMHTIAVRFDKSILADGFKAYLQEIPSFKNHLRRLASGTKVYATNMAHIASAEVKLPSPKEQDAISAVFSDMGAELTALEIQRTKTAELKQGMMQELLTGRIRLV